MIGKGGIVATKKSKSKVSTKDSKKEIVVDEKVKDKKTKEKAVSKNKKDTKKAVDSKQKKKVGILGRIANYFKEVKKEVSLVKWPSRKDMIKYSIATIAFVIFFALFFYLIIWIVATIKKA